VSTEDLNQHGAPLPILNEILHSPDMGSLTSCKRTPTSAVKLRISPGGVWGLAADASPSMCQWFSHLHRTERPEESIPCGIETDAWELADPPLMRPVIGTAEITGKPEGYLAPHNGMNRSNGGVEDRQSRGVVEQSRDVRVVS
jgi:hypothetical protein